MFEKLIFLILGFFGKYIYDLIVRPKYKIKSEMSFSKREDSTLVRFKLKHVGNEIIKDVRMRFECAGEDMIDRFCFYVKDELQCERLDETTNNGDRESEWSFRSTWEYLNPGDVIDLHVYLKPGNSPELANLEIDAQKVKVIKKVKKFKIEKET